MGRKNKKAHGWMWVGHAMLWCKIYKISGLERERERQRERERDAEKAMVVAAC